MVCLRMWRDGAVVSEVMTDSVRLLQQLDWKHQPPCEILWGEPTKACTADAVVWLTFVNGRDRVARKLACDGCVARMHVQTRVIEVKQL